MQRIKLFKQTKKKKKSSASKRSWDIQGEYITITIGYLGDFYVASPRQPFQSSRILDNEVRLQHLGQWIFPLEIMVNLMMDHTKGGMTII